eukprot:1160170-Pelagomonas_calceolata.AAC.11
MLPWLIPLVCICTPWLIVLWNAAPAGLHFLAHSAAGCYSGPSRSFVRIPWLIPLRIVLVGGYTILYARSGFAHPLLEALAVNGASLLVSVIGFVLRHTWRTGSERGWPAGEYD